LSTPVLKVSDPTSSSGVVGEPFSNSRFRLPTTIG
jgi:hypothetical protein